MASDLISRKALLEKAWDADTRCGYVQVVDVHEIENAPTVDAVEVVRCKDCLNSQNIPNSDRHIGCIAHGRKMLKDDYCSWGIKPDGGDKDE